MSEKISLDSSVMDLLRCGLTTPMILRGGVKNGSAKK